MKKVLALLTFITWLPLGYAETFSCTVTGYDSKRNETVLVAKTAITVDPNQIPLPSTDSFKGMPTGACFPANLGSKIFGDRFTVGISVNANRCWQDLNTADQPYFNFDLWLNNQAIAISLDEHGGSVVINDHFEKRGLSPFQLSDGRSFAMIEGHCSQAQK